MSIERRKYRRIPYRQHLKAQSVSSSKVGDLFEVDHEALRIEARDISEGGFGLDHPLNLKPGSIMKLCFTVGDSDREESEAYVRVVWSHKGTHGVQFLMLEDSALHKIRVYIGEDPEGR